MIVMAVAREYITVSELAEILDVSRMTILRMLDEGEELHGTRLPGVRTRWRISVAEVERLLSSMGNPAPERQRFEAVRSRSDSSEATA